ncbi:MAG: rRNA methyltransferase [Actinobacteria bacterium]|nr:MAG: rRNA methyltransferase [Actinomycetota bacterium]
MADLPADLRESLSAVLDPLPVDRLSAAVRRLIDRYRTDEPATDPILAADLDVAAYAAYRMPATYAAVRGALRRLDEALPGFRPARQVDVGGGTGAGAWAAAEVFPSLTGITVLDQVAGALALGSRLARRSTGTALGAAHWRPWRAEPDADLPAADLVTISYLLGELPAQARTRLVQRAAGTGAAVVVVEAGTPAGYQRVLAARSVLAGCGLAILAPCPHERECPLAGTRDWCHFPARVNRSALHRRLKDARLGHEDEKYSYVVAAPARLGGQRAPGRVLRHPAFRKGLVTLEVCAEDGAAARVPVSKRQGDRYRRARDTEWGDAWPPELRTPAAGSASGCPG